MDAGMALKIDWLGALLAFCALAALPLISDSTYNLVRNEIQCEPRGKIHVKGIENVIMTYWVTDHH